MATKLAALAGAVSGVFILAIGGGEAPAWLRCLLVLFFGALSLLYGFTAFVPGAPRILSSPSVIGMLCIWAGAMVLWVPPQAILSGALIGFGTRVLMIEHQKKEVADAPRAESFDRVDRQRGGELAHRDVSRAPAHRA